MPDSFRTEGSYPTGPGNAKKGMFISKMPSIAIPRRLSSTMIRSDWLTGAPFKDAVVGIVMMIG